MCWPVWFVFHCNLDAHSGSESVLYLSTHGRVLKGRHKKHTCRQRLGRRIGQRQRPGLQLRLLRSRSGLRLRERRLLRWWRELRCSSCSRRGSRSRSRSRRRSRLRLRLLRRWQWPSRSAACLRSWPRLRLRLRLRRLDRRERSLLRLRPRSRSRPAPCSLLRSRRSLLLLRLCRAGLPLLPRPRRRGLLLSEALRRRVRGSSRCAAAPPGFGTPVRAAAAAIAAAAAASAAARSAATSPEPPLERSAPGATWPGLGLPAAAAAVAAATCCCCCSCCCCCRAGGGGWRAAASESDPCSPAALPGCPASTSPLAPCHPTIVSAAPAAGAGCWPAACSESSAREALARRPSAMRL
jgi:hypothetical protein